MVESDIAYRNGEYNVAQTLLFQAENAKRLTMSNKAEIIFRKALCLEGLNNIEDAVGLHEYISFTFPKTEYAHRAQARIKILMSKQLAVK